MKARVLEEYRSAYPNPISFVVGDAVLIGSLDDEYPGWIRVKTADGNEGWAPMKYLKKSDSSVAVATVDYSAQELNAVEGECVEVLQHYGGWAWCLNARGERGWLPTGVLQNA